MGVKWEVRAFKPGFAKRRFSRGAKVAQIRFKNPHIGGSAFAIPMATYPPGKLDQ